MLFYFPIEYLGKTPQNTPHSTLCMEHKNESEEELENTEELDLDEHVKKMMTVQKRALENIRHAQDRQKRCYDAKHVKDKSKYKVGILVWVKHSKKLGRKGSKLDKNWLGPYRICEVIGKGTFRLCNCNDCSTVLAKSSGLVPNFGQMRTERLKASTIFLLLFWCLASNLR